jgi:hypothetical protein
VIEAAYRRLVRKYHPDVNSEPTAVARTVQLNEAYEVLRDPGRRGEYDRARAGLGPDPEGNEAERRFAEWYVWARREISSDADVCLAAAQAAVETLDAGQEEALARLAARRSVAGHWMELIERVTPRTRGYAEWYDWARQEIGGDSQDWHRAVEAALRSVDSGKDAIAAADDAWHAVQRAGPATVHATIEARCEQTGNPIVLRVSQHEPRHWLFTDCTRLELSGRDETPGAEQRLVQLSGSFSLAGTYGGCPYCGAKSVARCIACERSSCHPEQQPVHRCPWCGSVSEMSQTTIDNLEASPDAPPVPRLPSGR